MTKTFSVPNQVIWTRSINFQKDFTGEFTAKALPESWVQDVPENAFFLWWCKSWERWGERSPRASLALGRVNYSLMNPDWFLYSLGVFQHILNYMTHLIISSVIFQLFSDLNVVRTGSQHPSWHLIKYFMYLLTCPSVEFIFLTKEWCCDSKSPLLPSLKTENTFSQF